jgi:hypothetical protein
VLNAFVPCQEEGNIPYVTENRVGVFERSPQKAAQVRAAGLAGWLGGCAAMQLARPGWCMSSPRCQTIPPRFPPTSCAHSRTHLHTSAVFPFPQIVQGWFGERKAEFAEMGRRARALAKPDALFDICRDLHTLAPAT